MARSGVSVAHKHHQQKNHRRKQRQQQCRRNISIEKKSGGVSAKLGIAKRQ